MNRKKLIGIIVIIVVIIAVLIGVIAFISHENSVKEANLKAQLQAQEKQEQMKEDALNKEKAKEQEAQQALKTSKLNAQKAKAKESQEEAEQNQQQAQQAVNSQEYTQAMQNLSDLSGKYENLITDAQNEYGTYEGGTLILGNNPQSNAEEIQGYYNMWNNILNDVWSDLEANLPQAQMKTLTQDEVAWINSKKGKTNADIAEMTWKRAMYLIDTYIYQEN